ncbi:S24 family peptidase [Pseudomonas nitroreducens]|nr:helix-turn-helix transcriptional regulator [Pseudomonas nitroreducens]
MDDISSTRYNNLLAAMKLKGMSPAEFSRAIDRQPGQVNQFAGPNPKKNIGSRLARHIEQQLGLPKSSLDTPHAFTEQQASATVIKLPRKDGAPLVLEPVAPWDSDTPLDDDEVTLPLYKEVEIAAGSGRTAVQPVEGRLLRFSLATLRACGVEPANAICATASGHSMFPLILHGATIGIDKGMTKVVDGEIYALEHDGELRVKFVIRRPGTGFTLRSYNQQEFQDEDFTFEEFIEQRISIIGRVFWWSTIRPLRGSPSII